VDLGSFVVPIRRLGMDSGDSAWDPRWNLKPSDQAINIQDLAVTVTGASGFPPMLSGAKALGRECPFPP
jgi:hypothetical protein